ncbi:hypothetical protein AMS68_004988 [Peltaster fructicola]|uniref:Thioesterase domain-containing protein n=1 Tax=Peltaster fructicola TaxID=286661 RepID=A0A6H0XXS9_9PEZI|nr:hypothetical protein AMS68_004988 [Peltaster fructicola]
MALERQSEDAAKEFFSIPWTAAYLDKPNICWYVSSSRYRKSSNEDALFGQTFNSVETIGSCITVYEQPLPDAVQINEVHTLMSIGTALDGWPRILHGGIVATVIDEAMGILLGTQMDFHRKNPGRNDGPNCNMSVKGGGSFTATLNIAYKNPVRTPKPLVVTTRYVKRQGRKDWIYAEIRQFDDTAGKEIVCATGEALFIAQKAKL